ncbi:hypothetical protein A8M77_29565 [Variovorax sp. JS1663]|nr:hypothetical protein A8M77_29565 [Variovorax sp. JS1663]
MLEGADQSVDLYQLKYWVVPGHGMSMGVLCALATMTRRPVSRQWLMTEAGLSPAGVDFLLAGLEHRGALQTGAAGATENVVYMPAGFVRRLKRWLRGRRMASSPLSIVR